MLGQSIVVATQTAVGIALTILGFATSAQAVNPVQLQRLLKTKECARCDLSKAHLAGKDLSDCNLSYANLSQADLTGTTLTRTNLTSANLSGAKLAGAALANTNLVSANLSGAYIVGMVLQQAIILLLT